MLDISVPIPFPSFLSSFLSPFFSSFLFFDSTSDNRFYTSLGKFAMKYLHLKLNQECCLESVLFRVLFSIVSSCESQDPWQTFQVMICILARSPLIHAHLAF